jgi:TRAP-type C4-dicarboxylate transport system substrate-binding protein
VKKKILFIALAVVFALSISLIGCGPTGEEEEEEEEVERTTITLDFATFWPNVDFQFNGDPALYNGNTGMGHTAWMNAITNLVEEETSDYTIEWNTSSAAPPDLWTGVLAGTYDVITSGPGYTGGIMPLWEGPEYPAELPGRTNAYAMSMEIQALYDEFTPLQDEMEATGVKVMHFWSTGPGYFLMTEGNDVRTLADFTALDDPIRAANPASVVTIEALGAEALKVAMSQALEEFAAGTISGILCPTDTPKGFSLAEYIRSGTYVPSSYQFVFMKVMNPDTWDSLPSEVQAVFNEVNAAWPEYYGKLRTWGEADGLQYCYDEIEGFTMYDLPTEDPAEYAAWNDLLNPLINDWIAAENTATRQDLWDTFVEIDAEMADLYGDYTPGANPPAPPF